MSDIALEGGILIGKLLHIAYATDEGTTLKILSGSDYIRLSVSSDGQATLQSSLGSIRFHGGPAFESLGLSTGPASITLSNGGENRIRYAGTISMGGLYGRIRGSFDLQELFTSCSGLLCEAARILQGRQSIVDHHISRALGIER